MSALYGSMQGRSNEVTRTGHGSMKAHIRGWNSGVRVQATHDEKGDTFKLFATSGSNGQAPSQFIGEVRLNDGVVEFTPEQELRCLQEQ